MTAPIQTAPAQDKQNAIAPNSAPVTKAKPKITPSLNNPTTVTPIRGDVKVFIAPHRDLYADVIAQAMRVAGQGTQVLLVQPFQVGISQGLKNPRRLVENLTWFRCEADRDLSQDNIELTDVEKSQVLELWEYAKTAIKSAHAGLILIDQANLLVMRSLVSEDELLSVIKTRSPKVNVMLMGTSMPTTISDFADQVTQRRS